MDSFDEETRILIHGVHRAWKSQAPLAEFALLRDRVIAQQDKLDVQIAALSTVVRLVVQRSPAPEVQDDPGWRDFFAIAATLQTEVDQDDNSSDSSTPARKRSRNWNEICRSRNIAVIIALWSAEVVHFYNWHQAGQGQIRVIRACAVRFPDFENEFGPRLNSVLLARHCTALLNCRERSLNEARLQPCKDFNIEALSSATIDKHLETEWLTSHDGAVSLDLNGTLLKDIRPHHFRMYLLQKDRYGTLCPRELNDVCPADIDLVDHAQVTMEDLWQEVVSGVLQPPLENTLSLSGRDPPSSTAFSPQDANPVNLQSNPTLLDDLFIEDTFGLESATLFERLHTPPMSPDDPGNANATFLSARHSPMFGLDPRLTPQRSHNLDRMSPPSSALVESYGESEILWTRGPSELSSLRFSLEPEASRVQLEETKTRRSERSAATRNVPGPKDGLAEVLALRNGSTRKRPRSSGLRDSVVNADDTEWDRDDLSVSTGSTRSGIRLSPSAILLPNISHEAPSLHISSTPLRSESRLSLEEELHTRYYSDLQEYVSRLHGELIEGQRQTRAQWLTPSTSMATIWSSSECLGHGRAFIENQADVLYYTAADFVDCAHAGKVFRKPVVVKEIFMDHGMHTISQFLALLQDCSSQAALEFRSLGHEELFSIKSDHLAHLAVSAIGTDEGLHAPNLRNLTKSHRPLFTMLPRFRLLETLVEGLNCSEQEQTENFSFGLRACAGFNTIDLSGAFSGARVDALYGTWLRNLEGAKYCMIVPESEMLSEWDAFAEEGDKWVPNGKERLIILEEDDILLMPPGLQVLHAAHSPINCLMEGGILWDALTVLDILRSILWVCRNHVALKEVIPSQLPRTIDNLRQLVLGQPEKFCGDQSETAFLGTFESLIQALQELGCQCGPSSCGSACGCCRAGRYCSVWCLDHAEWPSARCASRNAPLQCCSRTVDAG